MLAATNAGSSDNRATSYPSCGPGVGVMATNLALAVEIADLPDMVRGYESIKLANVATYRDAAARLMGR